ncbi:MAG: hypothetical protein DRZ76_01720 [Candidatus Nealsonbacteria bacterium]|nr:MAG: hypothetical protein DRZ76_01720 [Candidatus Nealsonbacteria bacterium]
MERKKLSVVHGYDGEKFVELSLDIKTEMILLGDGTTKKEDHPLWLEDTSQGRFPGGGWHTRTSVYFYAGEWYCLASEDAEPSYDECSASHVTTLSVVEKPYGKPVWHVFLNDREVNRLRAEFPVVEEAEKAATLKKRRRQIRDALNKCADPEKIEEIGRLLGV